MQVNSIGYFTNKSCSLSQSQQSIHQQKAPSYSITEDTVAFKAGLPTVFRKSPELLQIFFTEQTIATEKALAAKDGIKAAFISTLALKESRRVPKFLECVISDLLLAVSSKHSAQFAEALYISNWKEAERIWNVIVKESVQETVRKKALI